MEDRLIAKKRAQRKGLLRALYGVVDGREDFTITPVQYLALGTQIGLEREVTGQAVRFLVSEGLLAYKPASEAVALTHKGVVEVERQADERDLDSQKTDSAQTVPIEERMALKLVTRRGKCFEIVFQRKQENLPDRVGVLYLFHLNDLTDNKSGQRLVSVYRFGPEQSYGPNYDARVETVLLNTIRRAFDAGRLTFDSPYDPHAYTEILLQLEDFRPQKAASGDEIQELIKHEAYWLGFRHTPNPFNPVQFDSPTDLEYLGVTPADVKRYVLLLGQRGLLDMVMAGMGRPTHRLIETIESSSNTAENDHVAFERMAIEEAKLSVPEGDGRTHPKVGVVVVKDGRVLAKAHRGEFSKEHAEFIALEKKLEDVSVVGATVYATLEPCTTRTHPKVPCAMRLAERRVARVFIGMLDPNPDIRGMGQLALSEANIETQLFPRELMAQIEELNREFIRAQKQRQTKGTQNTQTSAELEMDAADPRIYVAIKDPTEAMFPRTPFVLTNNGGDVAHRVKLEMPLKLNGRNVSFEMVETIPVGKSCECLPTIDEEALTSKHDIFHWLLQDWNGKSRGISEEWPKPLTVRYEDFSRRRRFEISMTLMFYPMKHMLKTKQTFPTWQHYKTWEFRDIVFKRVA